MDNGRRTDTVVALNGHRPIAERLMRATRLRAQFETPSSLESVTAEFDVRHFRIHVPKLTKPCGWP